MIGFPQLPLQAAQAQPGGGMGFYLMLATIGLIWFFLVIRPQQQRQKEHGEALSSATKGDKVVTTGGLVGKIVSVGDDEMTIEIGTVKGGGTVKVQVLKSRIESVSKPGQSSDAVDGDKEKKGGKGS